MSAALIWLVGLLFLRRIYTPWLLTAALALLIGLDRELSLWDISSFIRSPF